MAFTIESAADNGIELILLSDSSSGTSVSLAPAHGMLLHSFTVPTAAGPFNVIDHYASLQELQQELALSYKSSKLSPFACRIPEGKYLYDGEEFELSQKFPDGSAIHGLLFDKPFTEMNRFADDRQARVQYKYNYRQLDDGYPFSYRCEISYALMENQVLELRTTIINLDEIPIPVVDGWHPYFTVGGRSDDWLLQFNAAALLEFDARLIPTGNLLPYQQFSREELLGETFLDNCFVLNQGETGAACSLANPATGLRVSFYPDESYPYLQIYTPPHRRSIAIENLSGAPDAFNNKMGLLMLPAGHTHSFTVHYQISTH